MIFVVFIDGQLKYCIDITQQDGSYYICCQSSSLH